MDIKEKLYDTFKLVDGLKKTFDEISEINARLFCVYLKNEEDNWVPEIEGIQKGGNFTVVTHFCGETLAVMSVKDDDDFIATTAQFVEECLGDWGEDGKIEWIGE